MLTLFAARDSVEPYNWLRYESDERVEGYLEARSEIGLSKWASSTPTERSARIVD